MIDWQKQLEEYLRLEPNQEFRAEAQKLTSDEQVRIFSAPRLTFGTAGIRGPMGPGFSHMNDLVIAQTTQGLVSYLLESFGQKECQMRGIILGHDARHNSARFANIVASTFLKKSIRVYFCDQIVATPMVAHGVTAFDCVCGIVITASHNPKQDNGYKVYWSNGAQILSPHDRNIQAHIMRPENLDPWNQEISQGLSIVGDCSMRELAVKLPEATRQLLVFIYDELNARYFSFIEQQVVDCQRLASSSSLDITYTAMHGVGHKFLTRALRIAGFTKCHPVAVQAQPDPEFPTVRFPNPEEAGALELAFETANRSMSSLILANDPDADRCAAALYCPLSGSRRALSGNEMGALLGWWAWHKYQCEQDGASPRDLSSDHPEVKSLAHKPPPSDCYMLSTAVSSRFLGSMARSEGFNFVETLTGFKYMGNKAHELMSSGKRVLFAYEEAIGFMCDSRLLDKDGIGAAVHLAQCAAYLEVNHSRTLATQLDWLWRRYGYHFSLNSYYLCHEPEVIKTIFRDLQSNYPQKFDSSRAGEVFTVTRLRDLNNGFDTGSPDRKPDLPVSSGSFMVTFFIGDEIRFTVRTSGTEPKIKFYSEIVAQLEGSSKVEAEARLQRFVEAAVERCLKPSLHKLKPASA